MQRSGTEWSGKMPTLHSISVSCTVAGPEHSHTHKMCSHTRSVGVQPVKQTVQQLRDELKAARNAVHDLESQLADTKHQHHQAAQELRVRGSKCLLCLHILTSAVSQAAENRAKDSHSTADEAQSKLLAMEGTEPTSRGCDAACSPSHTAMPLLDVFGCRQTGAAAAGKGSSRPCLCRCTAPG